MLCGIKQTVSNLATKNNDNYVGPIRELSRDNLDELSRRSYVVVFGTLCETDKCVAFRMRAEPNSKTTDTGSCVISRQKHWDHDYQQARVGLFGLFVQICLAKDEDFA